MLKLQNLNYIYINVKKLGYGSPIEILRFKKVCKKKKKCAFFTLLSVNIYCLFYATSKYLTNLNVCFFNWSRRKKNTIAYRFENIRKLNLRFNIPSFTTRIGKLAVGNSWKSWIFVQIYVTATWKYHLLKRPSDGLKIC